MITWFCPECFAEVDPKAKRCPSCGASTRVDDRTYEEKLVRALDHHLSDRRLLAAWLLGARGSRAAVPRLAEAATDPTDPYLAAEAARSLALIEPEHPVVGWLRDSGPVLARAALREVFARTRAKEVNDRPEPVSVVRNPTVAGGSRAFWRTRAFSAVWSRGMSEDRSYVEENTRERERLRTLVGRLSEEELLAPVNEYWTVAAVFGHIAFWDARILSLADKLERGEPFTSSDTEPEDVDWINDASRPLIHAIPPGEAARLALAIAEETDARVARLPAERLWPRGPESPIYAVRAVHRGEHLDEVEAALRDRPTPAD